MYSTVQYLTHTYSLSFDFAQSSITVPDITVDCYQLAITAQHLSTRWHDTIAALLTAVRTALFLLRLALLGISLTMVVRRY